MPKLPRTRMDRLERSADQAARIAAGDALHDVRAALRDLVAPGRDWPVDGLADVTLAARTLAEALRDLQRRSAESPQEARP